ncbi:FLOCCULATION PROTEIN (DUF1296) [Salix koriyanagi]|uniref:FLOCCULATION PROTEIN (DUF1296) n=1 Tax=Salix koriyanagi TaxID=2511006 RepID=A0A9Q0WZR0_9ROSI|nr:FLOCCULATION PROTEIN (DUF1296) [Salix koriyanagi]
MQKTNNNAAIPGTKDLTATSHGPSTLSNGSSILGHGPKPPAAAGEVIDVKKLDAPSLLPAASPSAPTETSISVMLSKEGKSTSFLNGLPTSTTPASVSGSVSSFSDPILAPSLTSNPGAVGTIKCEAAEKNQLSEALQPSTLPAHDDSFAVRSSSNDSHLSEELALPLKTVLSEDAQAKISSQSLPEPVNTSGHVKFPNHYKVPEALKSGLIFGSFDTNSGSGKEYSNGGLTFGSFDTNSGSGAKCSNEPSSNDSGSTPMQVNHSDQPESPLHVLEEVSISEGSVAPSADSRAVQQEQDGMLIPEGHQSSTVQIAPNYGFGIMPPMQPAHLVPFAGHETQAWDVSQPTGFASKNSMASSTPSLSQQMQNSVAASPHPLLFRPPYPPNYLQYGHYFNPYFMPPMHQFLSHNGLPQQPSTGNAYFTAAPTAAGVKLPLPQFKPGTSAGSPTPIAFPTLYGSYGSSSMGFNPSPAVTSGSSTGNDDLSASQLKERNIYTTGPLCITAITLKAKFHLGFLHLGKIYPACSSSVPSTTFTLRDSTSPSLHRAGLAAFPAIYPPVQTVAAPSTVNQLTQQSQTMPATVEPVVPPSGPYQQPQLTPINWNS